jgi:hypothetical protein
MPPGLIDKVKVPQREIVTSEQAVAHVTALVGDMQTCRAACDVPYNRNSSDTVIAMQRMFWAFLTKQGQVVGANNALRAAGLMPARAHSEFNQAALNAMAPTVGS